MKSLIKYHFTVIFLHLLVTSCIFLTKVKHFLFQYDNINQAKIPFGSSTYESAVNYVNAYLIVSIIMLAFQLLASAIGLTFAKGLFSLRNFFYIKEIVLQLVGLFTYSCFILMKMNYLTIAYMWGVFCLIPFLLDVVMVIFSIIKNKKY